ncbi:hypothetical protein CN469_30625 [Bacillus cereus]|nr:hypothetical protein CN469_30625 [Bacillus cereus]
MYLPIAQCKEKRFIEKILYYHIRDWDNHYIHKEYMEKEGFECNSSYAEGEYIYVLYSKKLS